MSIEEIRYIHQNLDSIQPEYKSKSLHIALEYADTKEDWYTFKELYKLSPEILMNHLNNTKWIFDYNYEKLDIQCRDELFEL